LIQAITSAIGVPGAGGPAGFFDVDGGVVVAEL
jgi:hypothetical protein